MARSYERRLRILMALPIALGLVAVARLYQLQVLQGQDYQRQAEEALVAPRQSLPPLRGRILDRVGRVLVSDEPAHDVAIHYGILSMNPPYLSLYADHLRRHEAQWRAATDAELEAEVKSRIETMWLTLEQVSGVPLRELKRRRDGVCEAVERLRRHIWRTRHRRGLLEPFEKLRLQEEDLFHPILADVSPEVRTRLELTLAGLPFIRIQPSVRRVWSEAAEPFCHLLGRLGQVSTAAIEEDPLRDDPLACYRAGDAAGVSGVEALAEHLLRGRRGYEERFRDGKLKDRVPPADGLDVTLTLDSDWQRRISELLTEAVRKLPQATGASCVVLDVRTREVLALVSVPIYSREDIRLRYEQLRDDARRLPLLFRAVQGEYQPGSILKPVALLAGFAAGIVDPAKPVFCDGVYMPNSTKWHCWTYWRGLPGHGYLTAEEAIQHSCNVYFYDLGQRLGAGRLTEFLRLFVQGRETGTEPAGGTGLIEERSGLIPTLDWMLSQRSRPFRPADGRNYAIGQGEILLTPLQAANLYATIATGWFQAPVLRSRESGPQPRIPIAGVSDSAWQLVRRGLYRCVNEPGGTAYNYARLDHLEICGKTGSAQCAPRVVARRYTFRNPAGASEHTVVAPSLEAACEQLGLPLDTRPYKSEVVERFPPKDAETGKTPTHAWFAGFAPYRQPKVALAVLIEYGGGGGHAAGPVAREIFQMLLDDPSGHLR